MTAQRIEKRAIRPPAGPTAMGPYSPALRVGDTVYVSGQIPLDPRTGTIVDGPFEDQVRQTLRNLQTILGAEGMSLRDVVKVGIYLTDVSTFAVVNGIYAEHFHAPYPARSTIGVAALPLGVGIEIDAIAVASGDG